MKYNSAALKRKLGSTYTIFCNYQQQKNAMDYDTHVVGESTALASSHQNVEARGSPRIASLDDSAYEPWCTIYELSEARRRSANRCLKKYFGCLDRLPTSSTELNENGVSQGTWIEDTCSFY
jgi:hypothetical protein